MNRIVKYACVCACATFAWSCAEGPKVEGSYEIIPLPQEVSLQNANPFLLTAKTPIVYQEGDSVMAGTAQLLSSYIEELTGYAPRVATKGKKGIQLSVDEAITNPEGYRLTVTSEGIEIAGGSEAGIFYGAQALRKAIPAEAEGMDVELPAVTIHDAPRYGYRGLHFDVSRHFFPVDSVKKFIDMQVLHNMNTLHWHLTDDQGWRIEIKKYPKLTEVGSQRKETVIGRNSGEYDGTPYGGYYTQEQIKEVIDYAKKRFVTVVPEIDLPGHQQAALAAYPELGCTGGPYEVWTQWGISDDVICAGNDQAMEFLEDVLAEVIDLFPSEYIHIGGDECPKVRWKTCPKCQARIQKEGIKGDKKHSAEEYLQSYVIQRMEKFVESKGRHIIGWDEILEGGLAPNATVMSWRGVAGGIEAAKQHHNVIMTPNSYLYFDYYQSTDTEHDPLAIGGYLPIERVYSYEPMPASLTPEEQKYIVGVQANHWTEYIPTYAQLEYMALPRWAALCEVQWTNPEKKDYANFLSRLPQLIKLYDTLGYNYATHVFDVTASFTANSEKGTVDVAVSTIDGAPIHYTLDGTDPTAASPVAEGVVSINQDCTFKAVAVRPNGNSRILQEAIAFSKSTCKPTTANQPVNKQYQFKGVTTLTDGLKGNGNYKTGRWIAFYRNDMDVTIDLLQPTEISNVSFTTCVEKGDWVFDVRGVTVKVSDDGKKFTQVFSEKYPAMKETDRNGLYEHKIDFKPVTARYVRVLALSEKSIPQWHGGKGNPGFLFVDEISIR